MKKFINDRQLDIRKLNEVMNLSSGILKMLFVFIGIIGFYAVTLILKEWNVLSIILTFLKILSPFFLGLVIAWMLEPCIKYLETKGLKRVYGISLVYVVILGTLYLSITTLFPVLLNQINDFLVILPSVLDKAVVWSESLLSNFKDVTIIDIEVVKLDFVNYINGFISSTTTEIPNTIVTLVGHIFAAIGLFTLGLIIGFYLLFDFENMGKFLLSTLPSKAREATRSFFHQANSSLFAYLKGILFISTIIFIFSTLILSVIGVKTPMLLGLICGVTNIIPYIGPFIGGGIAVMVAFTQDASIGILVIIFITILQSLESVILHPLILGKTMKLHPVTILLALLIFEHFFGVIGMIIATPVVATLKTLLVFIEQKYNLFNLYKDELEEIK
jgi:predicted PurR-regulated permease PerM